MISCSASNASLPLLPEAGAQRTLEAVSCEAMLGHRLDWDGTPSGFPTSLEVWQDTGFASPTLVWLSLPFEHDSHAKNFCPRGNVQGRLMRNAGLAFHGMAGSRGRAPRNYMRLPGAWWLERS